MQTEIEIERERGDEAWDTEKETEKQRGDEDTVKETKKERGDLGTSYRRREKYLRLAITISFPTTVRSLSIFRPLDRRNRHRQWYIFFSIL